MATIHRAVLVPVHRSAVWSVLSDFTSISGWAANVDHSCSLGEQVQGVGAVRRIQTEGTTVLETIDVWEPDSTLSYRISGLPRVIKSVTNTWRLTTTGGATRVTLTTDVDAGSRPPQRLIAAVVARRLARASEQMLDGLSRHLETENPRTPSNEVDA